MQDCHQLKYQERPHAKESELSVGYYCQSQTEQSAGQIYSYRGSAGRMTFPVSGDLFQISLGGKQNYFEYQGGIDLD